MAETLGDFIDRCRSCLQGQLSSVYPASGSLPANLLAALEYALNNSGKQVRPILYFAAGQAISEAEQASIKAALALELIHTYSLIHDDLPAMDDDELRRGKPTLHKAFDDATAILVGDGLQARAFELIADAPELSAEQKVKMIKVLAEASGFAGMVGGQYVDIQSTGKDLSLEALRAMHAMKTGALIRASVALGGIAAGASEAQLVALDTYAEHIGLAFQVVDDILDVESDTQTLGKTQGKDEQENKATYVKLMGLEGAKSEAQRLLEKALAALSDFGESAEMLRELGRYIVDRKH